MSFDHLKRLADRRGLFKYQWRRGPVRMRLRPMRDLRGHEPRHRPNYAEIARAAIARVEAPQNLLTICADSGIDLPA